MAGQKFTLTFDAQLNVGQMKGALNQIQSTLNSLHLPTNITKDLQGTFNKLSEEVKNFEVLSGKDITGKADFSKMAKSADRVVDLFNKLKTQLKDLGAASNIQLEKMFPETVAKNISAASKAITDFNNKITKTESDIRKAQNDVDKFNRAIAQENAKTVVGKDAYDQITENLRNAEAQITEYQSKLQELNTQQLELENKLSAPNKSSTYRNLIKEINEVQQKLQLAEQAANKFAQQKVNTTTFEKHEKDLAALESKLTEAQTKLEGFQNVLKQLESTADGGGMKELLDLIGQLTGLDMSQFSSDAKGAGEALEQYFSSALSKLRADLQATSSALDEEGEAFRNNKLSVDECADSYKQFEDRARDISALKSRIQYFFGLNNAINLVKRAIRGAFETIKELDAAMTETAVVTNYTVKDMWDQLPEYTKRANELGVTTKDAYESATLYFQQGLNNEQAAALSVETLKMARIAGLDAAEATDRMTNALRGFNMELDTASAQRVDDVYSELAAISASNVDEISTAMTKVASLAHSANMEFETTAAFLAQIIETTRESAETAGTALKTVVARFSEVKKLVDTNQLKGTDEEGQVVDVNKVSQALRTAGIDLNKYFLGEVGLDDIFIELASKWDSLTSVQQRYIATQAAGSRQQSRFIALMQDYARTQELVGKAYNAEGASARQFEKTQDSLQSKLARLKNAWNEFLMGLTNNVIVKGFVDLLTNLLNTINSLTSAFGDGAGSILKWVAAISTFKGIKGLFKGNGILENILYAATSGTGIGQALTKAGFFGTTEKSSTKILSLFSKRSDGIKNLFNLSKEQAAIIASTGGTGMGSLTTTGLSTSLFGAAGAAVPTATIAGFGAILLAVEAGLTAWQDWVASGKKQVAQSEKVVKKQDKVAEESSDLTKKQKEAYESYIENEKIARTATGQEKITAEANMAEAMEVLYNIDTKNIIRTESGNVVDKGYAREHIKALEQQEKIEQANLAFEEARLALAKENVALGKQYEIEWDETTGMAFARAQSGSIWEGSTHTLDWGASNQALEFEAETWNAKQRAEAEGFAAEATEKIRQGAATLLSGVIEDPEIIRTVSTAYAEAVDKEAYKNKEVGDIQSDLEDLTKLASDKNGKILLDIINGSYEDLVSDEQLEQIFNSLPLTYQKILKDLLNAEDTNITDVLKAQTAKLRKSQLNFRKQALSTLYKNGLTTVNQLDRITNELTLSQQQKLVDVAESLSDYGTEFNSIVLDQVSQSMLDATWDDSKLQEFVNQLSSNPILTFDALNKAAKSAEPSIRELANTLLDLNNVKFSKENLVQYFLAGDAYENLTEKVEEFIKENGNINSHNIQELAAESAELAALLDNDVISANGLANAINALQEGNITLFDLNESVLTLLDSFDTVGNAIQRAGQFIKDFDPGEDWGDAYDFIDSAIEKMKDFVDNRELGNPQLRNYWKAFFTAPTPEDLAGWEQGIALLERVQKDGGAAFWTDIVGFSMDEGGNIKDMGLEGFAQSGFNSYRDYIKNIAESRGYSEFTDEFYDLMLRNMGDHDYGVIKDLAAIEIEKIAQSYGEGLEGGMPSKQDIQAIADAYGLDPQEILNAWAEKFNNGELIDFSSLEDAVRQYTTSAEEAVRRALADSGLSGRELAETMANGMNTGGTSWLLRALGANADGTFSIDTLYAKVSQIVPEVADGSMTPAEWVQEQIDKSPDGKVTLPVDFEYTAKTAENEYETREFHADVTVDSVEGYQQALDDAVASANTSSLAEPITDAITEANNLNNILTALGQENSVSVVSAAISGCITDAQNLNTELSKSIDKYVYVHASPSSITVSGGSGAISFSITAGAKGGLVRSYASGSGNILNPGLALTGEEAPEIIWNKEKGYAYLTGKNGPEIQNLQPGDQVFNGEQTRQILKRSGLKSFAKGTIPSYAGTIWKRDDSSKSSGGGGGGGSGSSGKDKTPEEWKNDLDWLYNLMEDIAELERDQKAIEEQYEDLLQDQTKTGKDLYNLLIQQLGNLYTQLNHQTFALEKREQEMREFMDVTNDQDQYLWYNWQDRTLEIDWDAIDKITDEEQYKHVKELIDEAEEIQDKIDDADDAIMDITNQIQELENIWRDTFTDFEDRVYDALVKSYQQVIDKYSELNDTLNNSNSQILDSLQKQISLERQIRDNTKTEEEITDDEARLAYLRRDTSGGNELAALQLERELADQRESYEDTLVDQAISRLQEDNDAAAQQRQQQIDIMQAQLDYQSQNGEFNAAVRELLETAMGADGELLTNSDLANLLKEQENWAAMSDVSKTVWEEELNGTFKEVAAFLLKENAEQNGTFYTALTAAVNSVSSAIGSYSQAMVKLGNSISSAGSSGGGGTGSSGGGGASSSTPSKSAQSQVYKGWVAGTTMQLKNTSGGGYYYATVKKYATGGLNTEAGPAWLDGSTTEPEYVLNARQTDAFLKLADVLPSMMSMNPSNSQSNTFGSTYVNLSVNLDSVSPEYDVDRMVDILKDRLYDAGSYRNVNSLSFIR